MKLESLRFISENKVGIIIILILYLEKQIKNLCKIYIN